MTSNKDFLRKRQLKSLLEESILHILAEDAEMADNLSAVPPTTSPVDPVTNNQPPAATEQQPQQEAKEFDVDMMVEKLNVLRGGRSLKDPQIYGELTGFFNKLSPEQKQMLEWFLTEIGKVVIAASETNANLPTHDVSQVNNANVQPTPPAQTAPKTSAAPTAPVSPG
jgi:hypothetical protein